MITQLTNINNVPRGTIKFKVMEATEIKEIKKVCSQVEVLFFGSFEWSMPSIDEKTKEVWKDHLAQMYDELQNVLIINNK